MRHLSTFLATSTVIAAAALAAPSAPAGAQTPAYPAGPVRMVVAFPPGAANDFLARTIGEKLSAQWKQPVTVENRPGASGIIGSDLVAKAPPDGHTLLLGSVTNVILPSLNPRMPYDPVDDFTAIAHVANGPLLLVVNPAVPASNVRELIALAKAQPGKLSYGTAGTGTSVHIGFEMFKRMAGIDIVHVSYKGSAPAIFDLIAGQTQVTMDVLPSSLPQVQAGKLRVLAVTGKNRLAQLPDVPTVSESGLPGFEAAAWWGVLGPRGLPEQITKQLNAQINRIIAEPEQQAALAKRGLEWVNDTPEAFESLMRADRTRYGEVVKEAGIKSQ